MLSSKISSSYGSRHKSVELLSIFIAEKEGKKQRFIIDRFTSSAKRCEESIDKTFDSRDDCKAKAKYYLEEANFDFSRARDMYLSDMRADRAEA